MKNRRLPLFACLAPLFSLFLLVYGCDKKEEGNTANAADAAAIKPDSLVISEVMGLARIEPPQEIITLNASEKGYVRDVRFSENQRVQKGDVLVQLDDEIERAQLRQAQSRLQTQRAAIDAAKATLASLQVKLAETRNSLERNQRLFKGNAATQQNVDDSRFAADDIAKQVAAQEAQIAREQGRLNELQSDISYYDMLVSRKRLRAPLTGLFLSTDVKPGTFLSDNAALGEFAVDGPYQAVTEIDELFAGKIQIGQKAIIRLQGELDPISTGKVVYVAPYLKKKSLFSDSPDNLEDRRVREVHVALDKNDAVLIGSRVECLIQLQ
ncbi:MAG: HlyD family efflux transporter periplasmic adaptor subunit [Saprospiraceae bacterium]|nr:HlyD family efflux transporter periplasmic adaptor subunit [Saprospiraceae bacterium]